MFNHFGTVSAIVGVWFGAGAMFVFLALVILYPNDRLSGYPNDRQGGVTPIEPIQTFPTGGFDRLDRPLTPNLGGMVTFSHGLMHL